MRVKRLFQVIKYGWIHAGVIAPANRVKVFFDILYCYRTYNMWSNQYLKEHFNELPFNKRQEIGLAYARSNQVREEWVTDHIQNKRFYNKWGNSSMRLQI